MDKHIFIIEDEKEISQTLQFLLEKNQYKVKAFKNGEDFFSSALRPNPCIFFVDWNLPGIKGTEIVRNIRDTDKLSTVFMISASGHSDHILEGLKCGADDYVTKPFNVDELLLKISNAQSKVRSLRDNLFNVGIKLIPEAHTVIKDGVSVHLTSREFIIFNHLYKNPQVPSTREELINQFSNLEMTSRNIDVHVFSLRKKISKIKIGIETVWGTGYKIVL